MNTNLQNDERKGAYENGVYENGENPPRHTEENAEFTEMKSSTATASLTEIVTEAELGRASEIEKFAEINNQAEDGEMAGSRVEEGGILESGAAAQGESFGVKSESSNEYSSAFSYEQPKKQKGNFSKRIVALMLVCSLVGGAVGAGGYAYFSGKKTTNILIGQREGTAVNLAHIATDREMTTAEIYAANVNSTVGITTSTTLTNRFGFQTTTPASGSGFVLTEDGYIVTNYHVIEGADSIKVTMYDNAAYEAELVGYDDSNDLAVLKVEATGLSPVMLGDSDLTNVGDSVIAIGNPLGELTFSLTHGVVSALNRKVTIGNTAMTLIQTDCAINSGNSGGALFNGYGEVIGITNAKYSGGGTFSGTSIDNLGFAIPINSVRKIITSIIEDGYILKPHIGVYIYDVYARYQMYNNGLGVGVQEVIKGSPAEKAGILMNDVITKIDGKEVTSVSEFKSIVESTKEGDTLLLTVFRDGETLELRVKPEMKEYSVKPEKTE